MSGANRLYADAALHAANKTCAPLGARKVTYTKTKNPKMSNGSSHSVNHPLPHYNMWRGNHSQYQYNKYASSHFGEIGMKDTYHQYYSHAKDPEDYGRSGRDVEMLHVNYGKLKVKPLPEVQYVGKDSVPKWNLKSWHQEMHLPQVWQREVQYPEHTPEHIGATRPLSNLAPVTKFNRITIGAIDKITITICPLLFGFGHTVQKSVMDFYRAAIHSRTPFPEDKVFLFYTIDHATPSIQITWQDETTYDVPVFEHAKPKEYIQMVMEKNWLQQDMMMAAGKAPSGAAPIDHYKWQEVVAFKKKKKTTDKPKK